MRVSVLAYHAADVSGPDDAQNDQVALAADLAALHREGWRVVPLRWMAEQCLGLAQRDLDRCVAMSCDDGTDLDWRGVDWPGVGHQPGLRGVAHWSSSQQLLAIWTPNGVPSCDVDRQP